MVRRFRKCFISNAVNGRVIFCGKIRRKLRMLAAEVMKLGMASVRVVKFVTVKTVRQIGDKG
jgi:hypothetical protein